LLIYVTVMYRGTKLVIFNFCTVDSFSILDKGSKNLHITIIIIIIIIIIMTTITFKLFNVYAFMVKFMNQR
ncbi:MAG: hypothetical protein N7Q72_06790, partial [Spiroplasma sp. Tabriz.8]|nr:hypothetical protein [Candidatus Regiella insecticola]MCZ8632952.1 hypothetical protein [Spiroplasma sp. Tabriz.8]